jgi:hypothetical protein
VLRYEVFALRGSDRASQLRSKLGEGGVETALKLNRIDASRLRVVTSLVVPTDRIDVMELAPFPSEVEALREAPKVILVSKRTQAFAAYEHGELVRWGPTSTGKRATQTPAGLYNLNWKARVARSTVNPQWILPWCFNLDNANGVAFHQFDLPGRPASHGCVRLLEQDAKWLYQWGDQWVLSKTRRAVIAHGTPVIIFGQYSYADRPPWTELVGDPHAADVSVAEISLALEPYLPTVTAQETRRRELGEALALVKLDR